jgi:copper transport protein
MFKRILVFLLILFTQSLVAAAHGSIERSDPADGSELDEVPRQVSVWFSEALVPDTATASVLGGNLSTIEPIEVSQSSEDTTLVVVSLPDNLPDGAYLVTVSAKVVSDGHTPKGSIAFWVGARPTSSAPAEQSSASPAFWIVPFFMGVLAVTGVFGWYWLRSDDLAMQAQESANTTTNTHFPLE